MPSSRWRIEREAQFIVDEDGRMLGYKDERGRVYKIQNALHVPSVEDLTNSDEPAASGGSGLRGKKRLENTSYLRVGNSYDEGTGAGVTANGAASLVATARGFTLTNIAVGGQTLADYVSSQYGSRVINAGDNIAGTFGLNDLRYYGPGAAKRAQFMSNLQASLSYLAIPDANKVHAGRISGGFTDYNPGVTYAPNSAAWNSAGSVFRGNNAATRALVTITSGASVSASVSGDTIFIWYGQSFGTAGLITPIIDGRTFASGSVGTAPIADAPASAGQWMLACICISGLAPGAHTVSVRSDSTAPVTVLAWAGINSANFTGANVYAVGLPSLRPAHWNLTPGFNGSTQAAADGKPVDLYELGGAAAWNAGMRAVCDKLRWQGLNVNFVDVSDISFQSVANADLHPEPVQHWQYAQAELAVMAEQPLTP